MIHSDSFMSMTDWLTLQSRANNEKSVRPSFSVSLMCSTRRDGCPINKSDRGAEQRAMALLPAITTIFFLRAMTEDLYANSY